MTGFRREIPSLVSLTKDFVAFSILLYDAPTLHFLLSLEGVFLRLYAFSQSCKTRPTAESLLIAFTREGTLKHSSLCAISQSSTIRLAFDIYTLAVCKGLYLPLTGHTEGSSHREVWKRLAEHWACLWASWGHLQEGCPWQLTGSLADRVPKVVNRIYIVLMSSKL